MHKSWQGAGSRGGPHSPVASVSSGREQAGPGHQAATAKDTERQGQRVDCTKAGGWGLGVPGKGSGLGDMESMGSTGEGQWAGAGGRCGGGGGVQGAG